MRRVVIKTVLMMLLYAELAPAYAEPTPDVSNPASAAAAPMPALQLGRLFLTPERRAALERQRQLNLREAQSMAGETLQLNGIVQRSGKKSTIWVNNRPQADSTRDASLNVELNARNPASAKLSSGDEAPINMRVGESINRATQERSDVVNSTAVRVGKPQKQ